MKNRVLLSVIAMIAIASHSQAQAVKPSPKPAPKTGSKGLQLGETYESELKTKTTRVYGENKGKHFLQGTGNDEAYLSEVPIALKAGQTVDLTAVVTGKDREVSVTLLDPTRQPIGGKYKSTKSVSVTIEELSVTGMYTIVVVSDRIGPFTERATSTSDENKEQEDEKSLEAKLKRLEREVEETKAKLKSLKDKR